MPRYGKVPKKDISPDSVYDSILVHKFINKLTRGGKKSRAESIVYSALDEVKNKLNKSPLAAFEKALENLAPLVEVKARRVGGATYQIPIEVTKARGLAMAMKWLRDVCRQRAGKSTVERLVTELIDAHNGTGAAIKKKEDLHKTAEANKAFAHFRW
ncbi:30S ribosomal protein S7 [Candidatus Saganbacteria bacterium CG08_land_8_20_14_0_20_45_16]|uniref:Small ribosomal subunit protein uS7 n=1 Tax=Candidatus Saganbacteria bacterium CG08_land_8_20_14_0_20_45_16 TaxID=2014293 RepID=A0A2H0XXM0_UNCSA|nr:MAG: 30S ribosomal protein S7 [Candidatus Saganbacteria bacterium CG08_land_8_20_14_0_20_45_16]